MKTVVVGGLTYELTPMLALKVNELRPRMAQLLASLGLNLKGDDLKGDGGDVLERVVPLLFSGVSSFAQTWAVVDKDNQLILALLASVLHKGNQLTEDYINTHFTCERSFDIYYLAIEVLKYNHFFPWEKLQAGLMRFTGILQNEEEAAEKLTEN